ncbi:helix-turn-helix domain-containing protein [Pseudalkalibacillus salsuginis]|uniref:helix-turn-helix domain-containing protein n=1 Tax=Pseudalkalibacillus salsuginis TaxID=2910972 RepID=UPI001F1D7520|nr:AraC family transcriptional regulator [Pseudalkalibacillus salsuginis]MCF6409662.1 AraC family transcriptional regulator [Pseudalkalibacillus salsuginis]
MRTINFTVLPPPKVLRSDIECLRIASHTGSEALDVKVCPNGLPGIVFQLSTDASAAIESISTRSAQISNIPILFLHGQGSEPSVMHFRNKPYTTIQVVFKSHALYTLFGMDASSLNQGFLMPDQFGAKELEKQLLATKTNAERITMLGEFLITKLEKTNKRDELIEQALGFIRLHISTITVKDLLSAFHISERQFQKRFARVVGMPPQLYIRVKRVNEALRMMNTGQYERFSDIAYALNFYDQSHFIRDIKAFSWVTPKSITNKVSEFHSDEAGSSYL